VKIDIMRMKECKVTSRGFIYLSKHYLGKKIIFEEITEEFCFKSNTIMKLMLCGGSGSAFCYVGQKNIGKIFKIIKILN